VLIPPQAAWFARPLETAVRLRHAVALLDGHGDPAVVGTAEEHLAQL
jgi:hypothetical protein